MDPTSLEEVVAELVRVAAEELQLADVVIGLLLSVFLLPLLEVGAATLELLEFLFTISGNGRSQSPILHLIDDN